MHSRMLRTALTAAAAITLAAGTATAAVAGQAPAAHGTRAAAPDYRRACAVTHKAGTAACMALIRSNVRQRTAGAFRFHAPVGFGYGPSDLASAYELPSRTTVRIVAVVDAYNDPNAVSDVATYRSSWGLPACNSTTGAGCLTVTNENGATSPLPADSGSTGWATEESLDVDMVSATCPSCHIVLVEASSASISDLGTAVNSAVSVLKAGYVSNSYGASESGTETTWDTDYYNHPGVAVTASAGDGGYGVSYPAASPDVTAVGGTTLVQASGTTRGWKESVWGSSAGGEGTGSGCSKFEAKPSWQTHSGCSHRIDNDVAAVANPNTGVAVYDTYDQGGWLEVGGTSASSPIIASVFALAGAPNAGSYPSSYPYNHPKDLHDVTKGANGSCAPHAFLCHAEKGYDGPTGLGTPHGLGAFKAPAA
ncbi:MAG TPA: S53 family peptidase [Streptosporangiaceae bacterium]|jgi:subtilase family serine protease